MEYAKIIDYKTTRGIKSYTVSYLEDLAGLITKVVNYIDNGKFYKFDSEHYLKNHPEEPNSNYEQFIESFKNSFMYSSSDKIHVIRGRAGVGKTLFFKKGIQKLIRDKDTHKHKYIPLCVDFKNIDGEKDIEYYENKIYYELYINSVDAIRKLGKEIFKDFKKEYDLYCGGINDTPYAKLFPSSYFCKHIYECYNRPCIIVFDNIDLASVKTQKKIFKATNKVCEKLYDFMNAQKTENMYRVYFAMRPETHMSSDEAKLGEVINFPLPNILAISIDTIKDALEETAKEFDKNESLKCEVTYYSVIDDKKVTVSTHRDVAQYFCNVLEYFLRDVWSKNELICQRLGTSEEFHCNIVNYNVRTFLSFFADTLNNGGFKPLTKEFNEGQMDFHYSVYDYIEMIIRGRWQVHPGNRHIDGEGGNKAPIIFNIFDTCLLSDIPQCIVNHFMLYIRILQYFNFDSEMSITYRELENSFCYFFEKDYIKKAVQQLVFVRILYSFAEGDDDIASKQDWSEVNIKETTKLNLGPTGKFYIEKLICEFEYLYQMAISSVMPKEYVEKLKSCWGNEKEYTVLYFLKGMYYIISDNLSKYESEGSLSIFKQIFCQKNENNSKPYRRMLDSFISVLHYKINYAEKNEIKSLNKLKKILFEAENLQETANEFFKEMLGVDFA